MRWAIFYKIIFIVTEVDSVKYSLKNKLVYEYHDTVLFSNCYRYDVYVSAGWRDYR
jgi:hypothetical protein